MNASPATLLVNVSGHFYEYTLKGEVRETDGQDIPDAEMLKKVHMNHTRLYVYKNTLHLLNLTKVTMKLA